MLVHAHVFNPTTPNLFCKPKKSDRAEYHTITCSASDQCELFARGQCIHRQLMGRGCPHGKYGREFGPTQKARNFYDWLSTRRGKADQIGCLKAPVDRLARVADTIWLPYSFMDMALTGDFGGRMFVPVADFTPALIAWLCAARPRALFGGEITEYQTKSVPLFVAHLSESFPDLLREAAALSPRIQAILKTLTKVGRKAKLHTLRPNVGAFEGWTWDGTYMIATKRGAFAVFTKFSAQEVRILPGDSAEVTITDDGQVTPETVFVD